MREEREESSDGYKDRVQPQSNRKKNGVRDGKKSASIRELTIMEIRSRNTTASICSLTRQETDFT